MNKIDDTPERVMNRNLITSAGLNVRVCKFEFKCPQKCTDPHHEASGGGLHIWTHTHTAFCVIAY